MKYEDIMNECTRIYTERGNQYGGVESTHSRAAEICNMITGRDLSEFDVEMVMLSVKLARIRNTRLKTDSWIDALNYMAFAAASLRLPSPTVPIDVPKKLVTKPVVSADEMEALEAGIKEMAQKLAPEKKP
jgi:hypothetical protein